MGRISWLIGLVFIVLTGTGCSSKIDGDVYVLDENGTSNKLASVDIYAVPSKELESFEKMVNAKRDKIKDECLSVVPAYGLKIFFQEKNVLDREDSGLVSRWLNTLATTGREYDPARSKLQEKLLDKYLSLNSRMKEAFGSAKAQDVYAKFSELHPVNFYSTEVAPLLNGSQVLKTSSTADGKFSLELPSSEFVLVAVTGNQKNQKRHLWMIKLTSKDKTVTLSDANKFDKQCSNCFLQKVDLSLSWGEPLGRGFHAVSYFDEKFTPGLNYKDERNALFDETKKAGFF